MAASIAIFSNFRFRPGETAHIIIGDVYLGFVELKFISTPVAADAQDN